MYYVFVQSDNIGDKFCVLNIQFLIIYLLTCDTLIILKFYNSCNIKWKLLEYKIFTILTTNIRGYEGLYLYL